MGFTNIDTKTGQPLPTPVTNELTNFGWEYVWHCHLLSHEEMDMMRPTIFNVARSLATAPMLSATGTPGSNINLTWTDGTPANDPATLGNPANEVGFRIERATGASGVFTILGTALANATAFSDNTTVAGGMYKYRVIAYNAAGDSSSNVVATGLPLITAPTNLAAQLRLATQIRLSWIDASNNETRFAIWRSVNGAPAVQIGTVTRSAAQSNATGGTVTFDNNGILAGNRYSYYVIAANVTSISVPSNTAVFNASIPSTPTNLTATATRNGTLDRVILNWADTSTNESAFPIQRSVDGINWTYVGTTAPNIQTYTQNSVPRNTVFRYRIRATNAIGASVWVTVLVSTP